MSSPTIRTVVAGRATHPSAMRLLRALPGPERVALFLLGMAAATAVAVHAVISGSRGTDLGGRLAVEVATVAAGGALTVTGWRPGGWIGAKWLGAALLVAVAFQSLSLVWTGPDRAMAALIAQFGPLLLAVIGTAGIDFFHHIKAERLGTLSDMALLAILAGDGLYVMSRLGSRPLPGISGQVAAALIGAVVVLFASWTVVTMCCPSRTHFLLSLSASSLGASVVMVTQAPRFGWSGFATGGAELLMALSVLALAATLVVEPYVRPADERQPVRMWWVRPGLHLLALTGTGGLLLLSATVKDGRIDTQSLALIASVSAIVGLRTLLAQRRMTRAAGQLVTALGQREHALWSLRSANDAISTSEERLRLLLEAAADGIVELDPNDVVVRANRAFCTMVGLSLDEMVGRPWPEVCDVAEARLGTDPGSLLDLPSTGEAMLREQGGTVYLEARSSTLPTDPPGRLLLIRDATARRVAEQTIRTLLHFLQDRDEDRTRLLKRTNSAIEAERNRIARDLHDGPIQGVSAASLSLSAAKLMMEAGRSEQAAEMLGQIGKELSDEATNLRRLMRDLRPPVLDERGLVAAVRELCHRWTREMRIPVGLEGAAGWEIPADVETLAYRVIQEALSNVGKHAGASHVTVRIESGAGAVRVEITDDGTGFDPTRTRDFLRGGKVGLASMRERTELAGGTFILKSAPGQGTTVTASVPFDLMAAVPTLI